MSNKKGGVAIEEITGFLVFVVFATIFMLFFAGCTVFKIKSDFEKFKFSRNGIDIDRDLNFFLESFVAQDTLMSDALVERIHKFLSIGGPINGEWDIFKNDIEDLTKDNLPSNQRLMLIVFGDAIIYDSLGHYNLRYIHYEETIEGVAILPIPNGLDIFEPVEVVLQSLGSKNVQ